MGAELAGAQLEPFHSAFKQVVSTEVIRTLRGERGQQQQESLQKALPERLASFIDIAGGRREGVEDFEARLAHLVTLPSLATLAPESPQREAMEQELSTKLSDAGSGTLYVALVLDTLQEAGVALAELRLEPLIHEAFAGAGLPDAEAARLLSELLRRYGPRYAEGAEVLLRHFKEDAEVQRFVGYDAEDDTFDPERYREATVRPLAYALLRAPIEAHRETHGALVATMSGLSAAEVRAAGRWTNLEPVPEAPAKRSRAAPKEKGRKTAPAERGSKSKAAGSSKQSAKKRTETPKKAKSAKTAPKKKPAPKG